MFLASLAFAAGIIGPNLAWHAPHVWLIAFLVAAACVCVLYGWRARSPAFPFAAMILARRRLLLAWLGVVGLSASALYLVFTPPKMQRRPGVPGGTAIDLRQSDSVSIVTPKGKTVLLDSGGSRGRHIPASMSARKLCLPISGAAVLGDSTESRSPTLTPITSECAASLRTSGRRNSGTGWNLRLRNLWSWRRQRETSASPSGRGSQAKPSILAAYKLACRIRG